MKKIALFITLFISITYAKVDISVSITPQAKMVKSIAGDLANITVVVPKGASPHNYAPTPSKMLKIEKSKIYFAIGVEFEKIWLEKFKNQNKDLLIVDLSKEIKKTNENPHIWLSLDNLEKMAFKVYKTLSSFDPDHKDIYEKNYLKYISKIKECKNDLKKSIKERKSRVFMIFHPAFTYFANEFNLTQLPIEIDGKEPTLKELIKVMKKAKKEHIKTIVTSPEFSDKAAKTIAKEIDAKVVKISPLNPDICDSLKSIVENLQ